MKCLRNAAMIAALSLILFPITAAEANPAGMFQVLDGVWRGTGRVELSGGNQQRIACKAYYTVKDSGSGLGFAIRCAAPSNKFELRGLVNETNGRLSGTWEERTYNAIGKVTGRAKSGQVALSIAGTVNGSMKISFNNNRQQVSISTATEGLKSISINLRR